MKCPYCGFDVNKLRFTINPENDHVEYRCICGNTFDEYEVTK